MKCPHCGKTIPQHMMKDNPEEERAEPAGFKDDPAERSPRGALTRAVMRSRQ